MSKINVESIPSYTDEEIDSIESMLNPSPEVLTEIDAIDLTGYDTKSSRIRFLNSKGFTRSQIAGRLNIRYQHVRNVLVTQLTTK